VLADDAPYLFDGLTSRALPLVTDSGPPSIPPAAQPTTPPPTAAPPPTLAPTPIADASDCRDRILAADLRNSATIDEVDECRFIEGGADAAAEVLAAGGTRDQLWAAVWVYASSGDDPAPLRPMASHDDPSIRVMAGAALTGLGDPAGPTALAAALLDDTVLVGSLPPKTVSEFAVYSLSRHVIGPDAPGRSTGPGDQPTVAGAWKSWLDEHGDALVYDPSTGEWSVR